MSNPPNQGTPPPPPTPPKGCPEQLNDIYDAINSVRGSGCSGFKELAQRYNQIGRLRGACHLFRHTMATLMLENGADIRFIQQMLRHARLDTTQIYTQVSIRQLKRIHSATHPAHSPKPKTDAPADTVGKAELLSALAAEDEEDGEPGMIGDMATVHMTASEVTKDFATVLESIRKGIEVVVEQDHRPVALIRAAKRSGRLISECIASAKRNGSRVTLDDGFARDVEQGIKDRQELWNPPSWD